MEGRIPFEDTSTDRFLWFKVGTSGEFFAKKYRDIPISYKSENVIIISAMISFLRRVALKGVGSNL
jgi:hypothetical protein